MAKDADTTNAATAQAKADKTEPKAKAKAEKANAAELAAAVQALESEHPVEKAKKKKKKKPKKPKHPFELKQLNPRRLLGKWPGTDLKVPGALEEKVPGFPLSKPRDFAADSAAHSNKLRGNGVHYCGLPQTYVLSKVRLDPAEHWSGHPMGLGEAERAMHGIFPHGPPSPVMTPLRVLPRLPSKASAALEQEVVTLKKGVAQLVQTCAKSLPAMKFLVICRVPFLTPCKENDRMDARFKDKSIMQTDERRPVRGVQSNIFRTVLGSLGKYPVTQLEVHPDRATMRPHEQLAIAIDCRSRKTFSHYVVALCVREEIIREKKKLSDLYYVQRLNITKVRTADGTWMVSTLTPLPLSQYPYLQQRQQQQQQQQQQHQQQQQQQQRWRQQWRRRQLVLRRPFGCAM